MKNVKNFTHLFNYNSIYNPYSFKSFYCLSNILVLIKKYKKSNIASHLLLHSKKNHQNSAAITGCYLKYKIS